MSGITMDVAAASAQLEDAWDSSVVPSLADFIRIPNLSPYYDAEVQTNGLQEKATQFLVDWASKRDIPGMDIKMHTPEGKTPLIFIDIPAFKGGSADKSVFMYGHLDKQPHMLPWREGLSPVEPVLTPEGRLYGRGGADDGYAIYTALTSLEVLVKQGIPYNKITVFIEASEESGSCDLPFYMDLLKEEIGTPSLIVCLDSGTLNYDQLWMTVSLRGVIVLDVVVETASEGVHSGSSGGIMPSPWRVWRQLLDRIEDSKTGNILVPELHLKELPEDLVRSAEESAASVGDEVWNALPLLEGVTHEGSSNADCIIRNTIKPCLSITGVAGVPLATEAGNVNLPKVHMRLSFRIPPGVDPDAGAVAIKKILSENVPNGAHVSFPGHPHHGRGWSAPSQAEWLQVAANDASHAFYGKPSVPFGMGGAIPFMCMLGEFFPAAQFFIVGILGPESNAHGPNEFADIPYAKKLTGCVSHVLAKHAETEK